MHLRRPTSPKTLISLVPMIDVMLILLVFFMVTSTYLNLDMIPVVEKAEAPQGAGATPGQSLLIRLGPDGRANVQGQALNSGELGSIIRARLAQDPLASIILLPSNRATTQQLVSVMDVATMAGAKRLRLIRLEATP